MFKKDFPEKSRTLLQKKESKKLKGKIPFICKANPAL